MDGPYFGGSHGADLTEARDSLALFAASGSITKTCTADGRVVTCDVSLNDLFRDRAGLGAYRFSYVLSVDDISITELVFIPQPPHDRYETGSEIVEYAGWLRDNYPQDYEDLFFQNTMLVEPFELAERHRVLIDEWHAST